LSGKNSKTIGNSIEETRQYHNRYFRAINSPIRRTILKAIEDGCATIEDLKVRTGLGADTLNWHLSILEHGFCIEKERKEGKPVYKLTEEGKVVDYLEK